MKTSNNFAVIGGGSWATAIVKMLCENLKQVHWYMRNTDAIESLQKDHHNPHYLSSVKFNPDQLILSDDINEIVAKADILIFVIPSAFLYQELQKLTLPIKEKIIYSAIKGIVPETNMIVGNHLHKKHRVPVDNIGVIAGPCHAEEIALERLSYLTIGCLDKSKAQLLADILDSHYVRCIVSSDMLGLEYAAMLKNIYAIAAGLCHALGYGDNFQSVLMSNAIREIALFTEKMAPDVKRNINDSAYLGDLLVTGYSTFSRNRMFGTMIGKGYTVRSAQLEMNMVAEGYYASKCAYDLIKSRSGDTSTPIIDTVYNILYKGGSSKRKIFKLTRELT